jgi:hypothetical protein
VQSNSVNEIQWSHYVCERCFDAYSFCEDHDQYYSDNCPGCDEEEYECSALIKPYSYKQDLVFYLPGRVSHQEVQGQAFTGFELEMEAKGCSATDGAEIADNLFSAWTVLKHDGSLHDGFEMVSQPMTRRFFLDAFPWEKVKELADAGMRSASTRTCGLHVHINKGLFRRNPTSLYRFMSMFYRNQEQWKALAGRSESTYAVWSDDEANAMLAYTKVLKNRNAFDSYNYNRYVALNLQNPGTIELRFFKGTLNPTTLAARIEAVHAVADYAIATRNRINIKAMHDWDRFREWTESNNYNMFNTYATKKGV